LIRKDVDKEYCWAAPEAVGPDGSAVLISSPFEERSSIMTVPVDVLSV